MITVVIERNNVSVLDGAEMSIFPFAEYIFKNSAIGDAVMFALQQSDGLIEFKNRTGYAVHIYTTTGVTERFFNQQDEAERYAHDQFNGANQCYKAKVFAPEGNLKLELV